MIKQKSKKPKIGRWILLWLVLFFVWSLFLKPYHLDQKIIIEKWDNFQSFIQDFSNIEKLWLKMHLFFNKNEIDLSKIQEWTYIFEWKHSKSEFLDVIKEWPKQDFQKYTVLEGWSIYDIDADLSEKDLIEEWDYISFVNSSEIITKYTDRYEFLSMADKDLKSLEWFLYPDTYHLDVWWNIVDQLVYLQLENFKNKVWTIHSQDILSLRSKFSWYDMLILASVVEKEERNTKNKPTVAGIFFNRLANGMRLDADITLCYGLHEPYETCTPALISRWIYDKNNIYNTRQVWGLPPQPISNPAVDSIDAVINPRETNYFYYLHDPQGVIHYGKTVAEHNENKRNYLN